jgi:L-alanine-DL-glutamate epimerase-like enolase superfamily enzyme
LSFATLCDALDIPILAAECSDGAHWSAAEFIRRGACDIMRTEPFEKCGFTRGLKIAHLAESFGMRAEVHGGGIASLHLGLAIPNITYYWNSEGGSDDDGDAAAYVHEGVRRAV